MESSVQPSFPVGRRTSRNHKFDLLRIFFATLVLLSHAPEMTDGNRSREIFSRLTHSNISFGAVGVDGFFLLSGFLIVKSWHQNPQLLNFLRNRVLRIVPGYLIAAILSTIAIGSLAPGIDHFFQHLNIRFVRSILVLGSPSTPPVLPGQAYPAVNGAMWTIPYEFRCYVLVALFGVLGLVRRRGLWLGTTALLLLSMVYPAVPGYFRWPHFLYPILGDPAEVFRLTAIYFVGGCFFLFRQRIPFRPVLALVAGAALLSVCALVPSRVELSVVLLGGYLMFYFGQITGLVLAWMKSVPDISYGIYLYGWPVQALWIWYNHGSPWITFLASTVLCFGLGWLSWHLVEHPMLTLKRKPTVDASVRLRSETQQPSTDAVG